MKFSVLVQSPKCCLTQLTATVISVMELSWPLTKKLMFGQRTITYLGVKNILSAVWKISKMIHLEAFSSLKLSFIKKKSVNSNFSLISEI